MNNFKKISQDLVTAAGLTLNGCGTLLVKGAELSPKVVDITIKMAADIIPTTKELLLLPVTTAAQVASVNNKTEFDAEFAARMAKMPKTMSQAVKQVGIAAGNMMSDV